MFIVPFLSPSTDAVLAPIKRKADDDICGSSRQKAKWAENGVQASDDDKDVEEARTQHENTNILKEKQRKLAEGKYDVVEYVLLDIRGKDLLSEVYAIELRAWLRQKAVDRWPCPAFDCNQRYTRKSHMKDHVTKSVDHKHKIPKSIFREIICYYCGDFARDQMIIQLSCGPEQTVSRFIQGDNDIQKPIPNAALDEKLSTARLCRQDAQISRIVEPLSASRSSSSGAEDSSMITPKARQEPQETFRAKNGGTTKVAAPTVGSRTLAKTYLGEDSSIDTTRPEDRQVSPYHTRDYTRDGTTRGNLAHSGCHDWHPMPHLSFESSDPQANWNASSQRSCAIPPLAFKYGGVNMQHSKGDFQISHYLDQPPTIPGLEYYDSSPCTSSEEMTRNTFMEGMGNYSGYFGRHSNAFDQSSTSPEVYIKQSSSVGHDSYAQSGLEETTIVSRTQDEGMIVANRIAQQNLP